MPGNKQTLRQVLTSLAGSSTLHGLPRTVSSGHIAVRILWGLLVLGATGLFCFQMVGLCREYYSYPTKTSVQLQFSPLLFPALTFCNMNPIRYFSDWHIHDGLYKMYDTSWLLDTIEDFTADDLLGWGYDAETVQILFEEFSNSRDTYEAWKQRILTELRKIPKENRTALGHQADVFIHSATFGGYKIKSDQFSLFQSATYGNCYTLDQNDLIARGGGQRHGITIVFNIEANEYFKKSSSSYGVRMVIHEKGTTPLPENEGISLDRAHETSVGIRLVQVKRLGGVYGNCTDGYDFVQRYKINYTLPLCYSLCEMHHMVEFCDCIPLTSIDIEDFNKDICDFDNITQRNCTEDVYHKLEYGEIECDCRSRCKESVYPLTLSGRSWPHREYLTDVLLKDVCKRNLTLTEIYYPDLCANLTQKNVRNEVLDKVVENFLVAHIYFEDLNYELVSEEPLYNTVRFLSDIGGAMGLYMGASLLTYVELLHVLLEIILHLRTRRKTTIEPFKN
ncbi:SCNNG-like protein [Mya arenaria]|uniref:SCNNG-like protein n=1 Tax=Mya arenaria TaxID=6604 RepID=A0ABY7EEF4_MYAAR|nr:amiloride-sensitive sodium channel subunit alpha-like [Mya arenaria]WAR07479.1 SCNNG-like protein [Mya arenaria]